MVCLMMRVMMPRATLRSSSICVTTRIPDPFPDCPAVIAGVGNGIDTDGEPDKDGAFMDVFHSSGVFSLNLTFFHVFLAGVAFHTFDICVDNDLLR